jgi:alpha-galactosidase
MLKVTIGRWLAIIALMTAMLGLGAPAFAQMAFKPRPANGLAQTPPMGWNSWNKFGCDIDEAKLRAQADALVATGMKAAGYEYLVIDDCWHGARDEHGDIQPDAKRFPSGIKALSDYVHSKGLKFGIYSDVGNGTCQDRPGSRGHEFQDAAQYARWGVDYLKYDWCNAEDLNARAAYATMADALRATGRPIVFSICEWGAHQPWKWGKEVGGNLWRTSFDIWDHWQGRGNHGVWMGALDIADHQDGLEAFAGPGHWNDPDMLEVGNGGMSDVEYRSHFALWAMMAAPLMAGNDLSAMTPQTLAILNAPGIIAIDQDPLGTAAHRVRKTPEEDVWVRPLAKGGFAVLLLNRSDAPRRISAKAQEVGPGSLKSYRVRDAWTGKISSAADETLTAQLAPHASTVFVLSPGQRQ